MLQFLTQNSDKYSVPEQCQMAIEGGCAWIQLHSDDNDTDSIRRLTEELIPLCRETSTILMLENDAQLARELGVHGIHLENSSASQVRQIRDEMGPEPIIGVEVHSVAEVEALQGLDIDYLSLSFSLDKTLRNEILTFTASAENKLPVVAQGNFDLSSATECIQVGFAGICTGKHIVEAIDPVEYTERMISALERVRPN